MPPAPPVRAGAPTWEIAVPARPVRIAGTSVTGFGDRADDVVDAAQAAAEIGHVDQSHPAVGDAARPGGPRPGAWRR